MTTQQKTKLGTMRLKFLKDDAISLNGRTYPMETVDSLVRMAQEDLAQGIPLTFFASHADGLADDASRMAGTLTRVWKESGHAKADVDLLDTSRGRDIAGAVKGGGLKTISLRCSDFATTEATKAKSGAKLATVTRARLAGIDATMNPGIPEAQIESFILESRSEDPDGLLYEEVDVTGVELLESTEDLTEGWLPAGTRQGDLDDGDFAWIAAGYPKTVSKSTGRKLPYKIHGVVNEDGWKAAWSRAHQADTSFEGGPSQAVVLAKLQRDKPAGVHSGTESEQSGDESMSLTLAEIKAAMTEALAEAAHSHVHSHMGADGTTYQHEHTHPHTGTSDHSAADAHVHSHNNSYAFEAVHEMTADQLVEAAAPLLERAAALVTTSNSTTEATKSTEAGRSISQANQDKIKAIHDHAADLLGLDCCPTDDSGGSDASMSGDETVKTKQLEQLTEALTKQTTLTEEVASLKVLLAEQVTAHTAALTEAQRAASEAKSLLEATQKTHSDFVTKVAQDWRPHRKVPVEALAATLTEEDGTRELSPAEAIRLYSQGLAGQIAGR